jgi:hypothetical protein
MTGGSQSPRRKEMKPVSRLLTLLASLAVFAIWANFQNIPEAAADHCSRGEGTLSGPAIDGKVPSGKVRWQGNAFCQPLEFEVEVKDVNLPDGTIFSVDACARSTPSNIVGSFGLRGGAGKLLLSKLDGATNNDNVPFCDMRFGDAVNVLRGSTVIVSGCVSDNTGKIPGAPDC